MATSNLTLVLPPLPLVDDEKQQFINLLAKKEKSLKSFKKILSRGERQFTEDYYTSLAELFCLPYTDPQTFPVAAIMAMGAGLDATTGYWLCAEPVYLHPDLDHVLLFDKHTFDLEKQELSHLVSEIDEMLLEHGITSHHGHQQSLFFRTTDKLDVTFTPISEVSGKNILQHLPAGKEAAKWRMLQNEIQMQMSQSVVNREREQRGLVSVNGLWFWGGGYLLRPKHKQVFDAVFASDLLLQGFAVLTATKAEKNTITIDDVEQDKNTLVAFELTDAKPKSWLSFVLEFEKQWLQPALALLKNNKLDGLTLVTGKTVTSFNKQQLSKFWKRTIKSSVIADSL